MLIILFALGFAFVSVESLGVAVVFFGLAAVTALYA